jgi:hypothetical protein
MLGARLQGLSGNGLKTGRFFKALSSKLIGDTMKTAKPLNLSFPFVRVMVRKRAVEYKFGTHKAKHSRVINAGRYMVALFPKSNARCPSDNLRVS